MRRGVGSGSGGLAAETGSLPAAARGTAIVISQPCRNCWGRTNLRPKCLEFLAELFNASNRETDYAQVLLKLFDLYCAKHDTRRPSECMTTAAEVDPYEPGHRTRSGGTPRQDDDRRFHVIASRFATTRKKRRGGGKSRRANARSGRHCQDLMLQAEILAAVRDHGAEGRRAPAAHSLNCFRARKNAIRNCRSCT